MVVKIILIVIGFLLVGYLISDYIVVQIMYFGFFRKQSLKRLNRISLEDAHYKVCKDKILKNKDILSSKPYEEVKITSFDGFDLYAKFYDNKSDKIFLLFHGAHAIPENNFGTLFLNLEKRNISVLLIDMRAHGKSEGDIFTYGCLEQKDVLNWIDFAKSIPGIKSIYLYGISMGAASIAVAAPRIKDEAVKAIFLDCPFTAIGDMLNHIIKLKHIPGFLFIPGIKTLFKYRTGFEFNDLQIDELFKENKIPTLFIVGSIDDVVPPDYVKRIYDKALAPKEFLLIEGAGHSTASCVGENEVMKQIDNYLEKY